MAGSAVILGTGPSGLNPKNEDEEDEKKKKKKKSEEK